MEAWIFALEVTDRDNNKGKVSLEIEVDDFDNWKKLFIKDELIDIEVL